MVGFGNLHGTCQLASPQAMSERGGMPQEVAMKMAVLNDEAAADQGMADRVAGSFMREVALLRVGPCAAPE